MTRVVPAIAVLAFLVMAWAWQCSGKMAVAAQPSPSPPRLSEQWDDHRLTPGLSLPLSPDGFDPTEALLPEPPKPTENEESPAASAEPETPVPAPPAPPRPISYAASTCRNTMLVFGDSTVDPGNNNRLKTAARANFLPYGMSFYGGKPTGRFSNGRLITDILAEKLGIARSIPGFLDPMLKPGQLRTGVSFASAGSGYDAATAKRSVSQQHSLCYYGS